MRNRNTTASTPTREESNANDGCDDVGEEDGGGDWRNGERFSCRSHHRLDCDERVGEDIRVTTKMSGGEAIRSIDWLEMEKIMDEQLIEELNNALAVLWKAGRKTETLVDIKQLEKSALLALSMGFNAESDDGIDYDAAYFNF